MNIIRLKLVGIVLIVGLLITVGLCAGLKKSRESSDANRCLLVRHAMLSALVSWRLEQFGANKAQFPASYAEFMALCPTCSMNTCPSGRPYDFNHISGAIDCPHHPWEKPEQIWTWP